MPFLISQAVRVSSQPGRDTGITEIWNLLPAGLGMLDQNLLLVFCNTSMQHLLALGDKQLANRDLFSLFGMDLLQRSSIANELGIRGSWQGVIHYKQMALRMEISRKQLAAGTLGYPFVITDCSEEYNKLQELAAAKALAEKTDRAKSKFLSHMSHELRTPLNAILGFSQLMQVNEELSVLQQDNLKEIESAGTYLLSLINEILDLSRIEAGNIQLSEESISLDQLFHDCVSLTRPLAEKQQISVNYELNTGKLLQSDHVRLKQVLLNLLSNAVKYNHQGGSVSAYCCETDQNTIHIEIRDTGPGIQHSLQSSIFSPFERLGAETRKMEGTGIGLMITRRLVQLMGGRIGVVSEPERGSVFWLQLPSVHAKPDNGYNMDSTTAPPAEGRHRELVCIGMDDTYSNLLKRCLTLRHNIQMNDYPNVHEAISHLLQYKPQCIFLSPAAAYELSMDTRNLPTLKNLNIVVVENTTRLSTVPVDKTLFSTILPRQHTLHELLELVDRYFSDK